MIPTNTTAAERILVAGIGNIFLGDDAFGVEVVKELAGRKLPESVAVLDFGIRRSLGSIQAKLFLVGCEPGVLDGEEGQLGLSGPVKAAVGPAVEMIEELVATLLQELKTNASFMPA